MSARSIRTLSFFFLAALGFTVLASAQGPMPQVLQPSNPSGPPLPEPLTWTLLTLAATGSGFAVAKRRRKDDDQVS